MPRARNRQRRAKNGGERKRKHHYVFQAYLEPWVVDKHIWCLREGEIFASNLENVACERFFYQSYPLTDEERDFVTKVMIDVEGTPKELNEALQHFLYAYCLGHELKKTLNPSARNTGHALELDMLVKKGTEEWLAAVEDAFIPFWNSCVKERQSFTATSSPQWSSFSGFASSPLEPNNSGKHV